MLSHRDTGRTSCPFLVFGGSRAVTVHVGFCSEGGFTTGFMNRSSSKYLEKNIYSSYFFKTFNCFTTCVPSHRRACSSVFNRTEQQSAFTCRRLIPICHENLLCHWSPLLIPPSPTVQFCLHVRPILLWLIPGKLCRDGVVNVSWPETVYKTPPQHCTQMKPKHTSAILSWWCQEEPGSGCGPKSGPTQSPLDCPQDEYSSNKSVIHDMTETNFGRIFCCQVFSSVPIG